MNHSSNNTIYQVDAFTDQVFKGNPAAVMILDALPSETYMRNMAMEMNLSETAFVVPQDDRFQIRFYTPEAEILVAGHPTLASAHILYELGVVQASDEITFEAKEATMRVRKEGDQIVMNFPKFSLQQIQVDPVFPDIVGFNPVELHQSDYNWKVAVAASVDEVVRAKPNFSLLNQHGFGHLMITAKSESGNEDFVVRCFAPDLGVDEDPVTGSAHCALTPLWAEKLGKTNLVSRQLSKRSGEISVSLVNDRVLLKGKAVTVFEAHLK
jgi:PhzF family phenazine biosynthesis protein